MNTTTMRRIATAIVLPTALVLGAFAARTADASIADPNKLRVLVAGRDTLLALVTHDGATMIEAGPLFRFLGGTVETYDSSRFQLRLGTLDVEIRPGLQFFRVDSTIWPLANAPALVTPTSKMRLLVPYQFVTEFLPRLVKGVQYDGVRGELRVPTQAVPAVAPEKAPAPAPAPRKRVVVVDAGHGGEHPGMRAVLANGRVVYEKAITLGIAKKLATALRERGFQVVMTRDRDTLIALTDRGDIANRSNGDIFLSIHVNANGPSGSSATRGFETYFLAEALTEDAKRVEAMENEVIRSDGSRGSATEGLAFIFSDMVQNEHLRESSALAETIQRGIDARRHPGPDRGVKQAKFLVLVTAFMPAVLIETGYGTNKSEAAWLASEVGQSTLASAIANATVAYFKDFDRRMGAHQP